jgi:hypothetical protein
MVPEQATADEGRTRALALELVKPATLVHELVSDQQHFVSHWATSLVLRDNTCYLQNSNTWFWQHNCNCWWQNNNPAWEKQREGGKKFVKDNWVHQNDAWQAMDIAWPWTLNES